MKKMFALVLALTLVLSLAACGSGNTPATSEPAKASPSDGPVTIESIWPDGSTVYFDVPAKAGGGTDLYTRILTQALQETYPKVNFIVTNYDTAEVGAEHAKNADPDGLTLTIAACTGMDNYLSGQSEVNPNVDYTTVAKLHDGGPQAIIAQPGAPYTNLKEFGEYIAAHPGEVVVGCALGGTSQIILRSIIASLGEGYEDMVNYVQCGSEADKLTQTASKAIDIANCSIPNAQSYEADGKLTILGTIGPRVATLETMSELVGLQLPDTFKTTMEQGIDFSWDAGYYVMAPAATSDAVCEALNGAMQKASEQQSFQDGMKKMASYPNVPDLAGARADWAAEWDFQVECITGMGLMAR